MSKKKKVVIADSKKGSSKPSPTTSRSASADARSSEQTTLLFGRENYMYMIGGVVLIFLSFLLMSGGSMPSPDVWDESIIYSFRRITLAPILLVAGLVLEIVGIFK